MKTILIRQSHNSPDLIQLNSMLDALKGFLDAKVDVKNERWLADFEAVIAFQDNDGSFNLLDSFNVESDARVDFCYLPTYICTAILMKAYMTDEGLLKDRRDVLKSALDMCCSRNLTGHGYEAFSGQLEALNTFAKAGLREFVLYHAEISPKFTTMIKNIVGELKKKAAAGETRGIWGEDYKEDINDFLDYFSRSEVFVYGTLMTGESNHEYYLGDLECDGKAVVDGFDMYDIGSYPGIVPGNGAVKGELYTINEEVLNNLDYLEGEGSLYIRKCVPAITESGDTIFAHIYVYNGDVSSLELIPDYFQPYTAGWKNKKDGYVWYVSYGSNMCRERFLCYIKGGRYNGSRPLSECSDTSEPLAVRPVIIPHNMYFAKYSSQWDGGVSFLDPAPSGRAFGVAYLITQEQYDHVARQENGGNEPELSSWYNYRMPLGEIGGIRTVTLTNVRKCRDNDPSDRYLDVLRKGLKENYPDEPDGRIDEYLITCTCRGK